VLIRKQFVSNYLEFETKNLIEHIYIYGKRRICFLIKKKEERTTLKEKDQKSFPPKAHFTQTQTSQIRPNIAN